MVFLIALIKPLESVSKEKEIIVKGIDQIVVPYYQTSFPM